MNDFPSGKSHDDKYISQYVISSIQMKHSDDYTCVAANVMGKGCCFIKNNCNSCKLVSILFPICVIKIKNLIEVNKNWFLVHFKLRFWFSKNSDWFSEKNSRNLIC